MENAESSHDGISQDGLMNELTSLKNENNHHPKLLDHLKSEKDINLGKNYESCDAMIDDFE